MKNPEDVRPGSCGYPTEGFYVELRNPENIQEVIRPHWDPYADATPPDSAKGILYIRPLVPNTTLNEYFKDEGEQERPLMMMVSSTLMTLWHVVLMEDIISLEDIQG